MAIFQPKSGFVVYALLVPNILMQPAREEAICCWKLMKWFDGLAWTEFNRGMACKISRRTCLG